MYRLSTLIWMLVIVVAAFMLYMVKYQVQSLQAQVAETSRQLAQEREALHVTAAEWAYLNRPQRLKALVAKYLSATGVTVDQIAEIEAVPFPAKTHASIKPEEGIQPASVTFKYAGDAQ